MLTSPSKTSCAKSDDAAIDPVYGGYFQRALHIDQHLPRNRETPLLEGWDFGHGHPCVVRARFVPSGAMHVLSGVIGASMFIEDFRPVAPQYRAQWFPGRLEVRSTGDPAGESFSPHGIATSAGDVLRKHRVDLQFFSGANRVDHRDIAIQPVAGYIRRLTPPGPAFRVAPQSVVVTKHGSTTTPVLVNGFEAGYVWNSKSSKGTTNANTRPTSPQGRLLRPRSELCGIHRTDAWPEHWVQADPGERPEWAAPPGPLSWMAN